MKIFNGRPVIKGELKAEAVVTHNGFDMLASFQKSMLKKDKNLICSDHNNKEVYGKNLTGKILCIPQTIGSTEGGNLLQTVAVMGIAPSAILFSKHIDSQAAAALVILEMWQGKRIITVDNLGEEFLDYVKSGMEIEIDEEEVKVL